MTITRLDVARLSLEAAQGRSNANILQCNLDCLERFAALVTANNLSTAQFEAEALRLRLITADAGAKEAARAESLYREAEALLTGDERSAIARAVAAEREACANIATDRLFFYDDDTNAKLEALTEKIATAIRSRK